LQTPIVAGNFYHNVLAQKKGQKTEKPDFQALFKKVQHWLFSQTKPFNRHLRMANGVILPSQGVWKGMLQLGGLKSEGEFEVFDSGSGWEF